MRPTRAFFINLAMFTVALSAISGCTDPSTLPSPASTTRLTFTPFSLSDTIATSALAPTRVGTSMANAPATIGTPAASPTRPPGHPPRICPDPDGTVALEIPDTSEGIESVLLEYLNRGGSPAGLAPAFLEADPESQLQLLNSDLSGDGLPEIVFTVVTPGLRFSGVFLFQCAYHDYLANQDTRRWDPEYRRDAWFSVSVSAQSSLIAPGSTDLLIQWNHGPSYCEHQVRVVAWVDGDWQNYYVGEAACPAEVAIRDVDGDHIREVALLGTEGAFTGGRPWRIVLRTYQFDPTTGAYVQFSREMLPSHYRIHVLDDAERVLAAHDYSSALDKYDQAAWDEDLLEWPSSAEIRATTAHEVGAIWAEARAIASPYQRAFALFRSVAIWLRLGFTGQARADAGRFPELLGDPQLGVEFSELARFLLGQYATTHDISIACLRTNSYASENYPGLMGHDGHIGDWPGSEADYTYENLCPF